MMIEKIAFDLDGVLTDYNAGFLPFYNKRNGTNFRNEDMFSHDYTKVFNVSGEHVHNELDAFYQSPAFDTIPPEEGAEEAIRTLHVRNPLYVITARPDATYKKTIACINGFFLGGFLKIHFTGYNYGNGGPKQKKSIVCLTEGYTTIVEDSIENARECAERGIRVLLRTKPWNVNEEVSSPIQRVENLQEVLKILQ